MAFERKLLLSPPEVTDLDRKALLEAFDSGWIAPVGPHLEAFEEAMAERAGRSHAVGLSSGTAALHLSLVVAGVGPGDTVLVSDLTFAATANAVVYCGAEPVLVDCDPGSWNLDPDLVEEALEEATGSGRPVKAVIAVDLYGQVADFERLAAACERHGAVLIEDAAEALGSTHGGRPAGSFGELSAFSFNGNKIITTSGGGMVVTDRPELADRVRHLATQARQPVLHYEHTEIGFNYRLSNLLAALGTSQLTSLDERVEHRRRINAAYRAALGSHPGISFMPDAGTGEPNWWLTALTVDPAEFGADRDAVIAHLAAHGAEARPVWKPMHLQPVFAGARFIGPGSSARVFEQGVCLPSGHGLGSAEVDLVASLVLDAGAGS